MDWEERTWAYEWDVPGGRKLQARVVKSSDRLLSISVELALAGRALLWALTHNCCGLCLSRWLKPRGSGKALRSLISRTTSDALHNRATAPADSQVTRPLRGVDARR